MKRNKLDVALSDRQIENELQRTYQKRRHWAVFRTVTSALIVAAALVVLITTFWFPIYRVVGESLESHQDTIVVANKSNNLRAGDLAALYHDGQILMKRVIGLPGDVIRIEQDKILVNDIFVGKKYQADSVLESTNLAYPYQVPEGSYFVIDGHLDATIDSDGVAMECVPEEIVAGKILFCIWPIQEAGLIG